ncbi:SHOCT domain-containing protein [Fictibacillus sp. KU28468]|uniref:SHOCT domain-containing protein n=1 Tax=Fictibacillus sp. KU28468 TaxID=2991053 RepID=UPI00223D3E20|nr:SHOCT domain-containing protein [Fictibacillus sp. KU28468]UZJ78620.1 SHOCT domain-containing protein [Fictibacillus sp. KU28468]
MRNLSKYVISKIHKKIILNIRMKSLRKEVKVLSNTEKSNSLELIITNALKVPGVKVNRTEFLSKILADQIEYNDLVIVLEKGPIEAGVNINTLDKLAKSLIEKRTLQSTGASFAAGLPGGLAMAATIPADTLQFYGVSLRLAQELAYIYGYKDLWEDDQVDAERVRGELTLFLGVMFGVGGTASALKVLSSKVAQQVLKKLPQKALMKTIYYPIFKKVASTIGVKVTKKTFAQGVSKAIPLLGGVISGGLTYASMKPMGTRLRTTLYESVNNYSKDDLDRDLQNMKREMPDFIDAEFTDVEEDLSNDKVMFKEQKVFFSAADEILKYKQLLDMGVITQEEFDRKKEELLNNTPL